MSHHNIWNITSDKTWALISILILTILNGIWIWMVYALYDSCDHKTGWFPICFSKLELLLNLGITIAGLAIAIYLGMKHTPAWRISVGGIMVITVQVSIFTYVLN
jgi:hypothetical protein